MSSAGSANRSCRAAGPPWSGGRPGSRTADLSPWPAGPCCASTRGARSSTSATTGTRWTAGSRRTTTGDARSGPAVHEAGDDARQEQDPGDDDQPEEALDQQPDASGEQGQDDEDHDEYHGHLLVRGRYPRGPAPNQPDRRFPFREASTLSLSAAISSVTGGGWRAASAPSRRGVGVFSPRIPSSPS